MMLVALAGLLAAVIAAAALWHLMPSNGKIHPWVTMPYLESTIPLVIMAGFVLGLATIGTALVSVMLGAE
jgi:hypothetical protein